MHTDGEQNVIYFSHNRMYQGMVLYRLTNVSSVALDIVKTYRPGIAHSKES